MLVFTSQPWTITRLGDSYNPSVEFYSKPTNLRYMCNDIHEFTKRCMAIDNYNGLHNAWHSWCAGGPTSPWCLKIGLIWHQKVTLPPETHSHNAAGSPVTDHSLSGSDFETCVTCYQWWMICVVRDWEVGNPLVSLLLVSSLLAMTTLQNDFPMHQSIYRRSVSLKTKATIPRWDIL